jgi:hypothetical protein
MYRVTAEEIIVDKSYVFIECDSKSDVTDNMTYKGRELIPFSKAVTKDLDVGVYDSTGHWNWN